MAECERCKALEAALRGALAEKERELEGFRKSHGRYPLLMSAWVAPARAALAAQPSLRPPQHHRDCGCYICVPPAQEVK